jgi:hypothetical protein
LIVLSRPGIDYELAFARSVRLPPEAESLYFFPRGRDALLLAMRALRVMSGDAVVIPAYICDSTIEPLRQAGYRIVFVDIERDFQLDLDKVVETAERCGAKAVLAVHYFGFPSNVGRLVAQLRPRGIRVIEDCCHSFLTHSGGRRIGSYGDAAIFSMRKTLPIPDGGSLRLNVQDFDRAALGARSEVAPAVGCYLASRVAESMAVAVGWPNIYSQTVDELKTRIGWGRGAHGRAQGADDLEPRQQGPSKLLASYLSNENYLGRVSGSTAANYAQLVEGALALGLQPYIPQLPSGCVPQWAPFYDPSGRIVPWLRKHGVGACRWPWHELPFEVASLPLSYPRSNELSFKLALMPVHQSIGPRQMARMLLLLGQLVDWRVCTSNEETVE